MEAENAYTLPMYDTFNIESSTTGMENLDFSAKILDIPDCVENENSHLANECEEAVVLDSDDERRHRTEVESISKLRSSDDTRYKQRLDKWKFSPASRPTYVGCLRRSKNLFKYMDSARITTNFENTNQQKQFSEVSGRISSQVDKLNASTEPRVEEDWCQAVEITKDEIFEGNVEKEALTGYGMDGDKDFPLHSCNTESQIPEELSEADALDFVDHYLSVYNEDALNEVKAARANKIISPPIFSRKGPQRLASRMNVQNAVKNSRVFDWPERQSDSGNSSFSRHRKILTYHRKNYGPEKQKVSSVQSSKEPMESMIRKLDEQFDKGAFEQQVESEGNQSDVLDTYDVGFDTQMAAEAMETLLYAPPLKSDAVCTPRFPEISLVKEGEYPERGFSREFIIDDSSSEPTEYSSAEIELLRGKTIGLPSRMNVQNAVKISGVFDWPERQSDSANGSFSRHRKILTYHRKNDRLRKQKVSSVQSSKEPMGSMANLIKVEPNFLRKSDEQFDMGAFEKQIENDGNRSDVLDTYDVGLDTQLAAEAMETLLHAPSLGSDAVCAPHIPETSLVKEGEYHERAFSREFNIDDSSSEPTECSSAEIELLRGKTRGFSSVVHRTRHQVSLNFRSLESEFPKKRRKPHEVGELNDNLFQVAAVRGKVSKPGTNTSRKSRNVSLKKQGEIRQSIAATLSQVKLENWASKGKRTRTSYSSICKYPVTSQQMMPMDFKRVESTESAKLNEMTSTSTNILTKDMKSDIVSSGNSDPSYSLNDHKKGKQHLRSLSRSTLTQELIRLGYAEKLPDFLPRGSRRRKCEGDVRVLFSQSLDSKLIKQQKKILARLGFISVSNCSNATHFVTESFVRTRNMLEAIACGKPIVTHLWLNSCGRASCFVDEKKYILRDAKKEKELGFTMPASLARARKHPLLEDQRVIITPGVKPDRDTLLSLVKAVHGEVVDESNSKITYDDLLVISCEEDHKICLPYLKKGFPVYNSELLLNGIVIQKLEYNRHQLFTKFHDKSCKE
ncbi:uncharacterized protein LOC132605610 isoform X2 [Lycium barbarum]|uniref:uncharacterized protein LOC132605610 isoform X2 n=1 Tax=Lycium barbarum TaxID=112863 RepID=UPI00293EC911|nr:uncharacterized protein LOC132605610 isoform X2 [Lycium barbarum]